MPDAPHPRVSSTFIPPSRSAQTLPCLGKKCRHCPTRESLISTSASKNLAWEKGANKKTEAHFPWTKDCSSVARRENLSFLNAQQGTWIPKKQTNQGRGAVQPSLPSVTHSCPQGSGMGPTRTLALRDGTTHSPPPATPAVCCLLPLLICSTMGQARGKRRAPLSGKQQQKPCSQSSTQLETRR